MLFNVLKCKYNFYIILSQHNNIKVDGRLTIIFWRLFKRIILQSAHCLLKIITYCSPCKNSQAFNKSL